MADSRDILHHYRVKERIETEREKKSVCDGDDRKGCVRPVTAPEDIIQWQRCNNTV